MHLTLACSDAIRQYPEVPFFGVVDHCPGGRRNGPPRRLTWAHTSAPDARGENGEIVREKVTRLFVTVAIAEAFSWLGLLIAMGVKYGPLGNELGVKIFGPLHGFLFVAYGVLVLLTAWQRRWSVFATGLALVCAVPPLATLAFERWARKRGMLTDAAPATPEPAPVG